MAETRHIRTITGEFDFLAVAPRNRNPGSNTISTMMTGAAVGLRLVAFLREPSGFFVAQVYVEPDGSINFYDVAAGEYEITIRGQGIYRTQTLGPFSIP